MGGVSAPPGFPFPQYLHAKGATAMPVFSKKYKLGLDIGSSLIKVCLPSTKGRPLIWSMETPAEVVSKGVLQNPEGLSEFLRQWIKKNQLDHHYVVATLPASTLVLRHIQLPRMKTKETAEAVQWEARRVLPFSLEEAQMDWVSHGLSIIGEGEMQDILLVAVRDAIAERYAKAINDAGLKLLALDIAPMALGRWLLRDTPDTTLILIWAPKPPRCIFTAGQSLFFPAASILAALRPLALLQQLTTFPWRKPRPKKFRVIIRRVGSIPGFGS